MPVPSINHDNVIAVLSSSGVNVLQADRDERRFRVSTVNKLLARPSEQIDVRCVGLLMIRGDYPPSRAVDESAKAKSDSLKTVGVFTPQLT
jgi:hypothetical protein